MLDIHAVIMAGGGGTRFWPNSRVANPKQFLPIIGDDPLITQTFDRLGACCNKERILVITNARQAAGTAERLPEILVKNIIAEPMGRNTAPCVGLAAIYCQERSKSDPVIGVFPADACINPVEEFSRTVACAAHLAKTEGAIVTIGIPPTFPATGYGYIQQGESLPADLLPAKGTVAAHKVIRFTEKPDQATAQGFLADGGYSWNAGIFFFRSSTVLAELKRQQPEIYELLEKFRPQIGSKSEIEALAEAYQEMPAISFDYAVMENAESVYTVDATFDWDDLGSWASIARHLQPDPEGNFIKGDTIAIDSHGNTVDSNRLVALVGVDDLVIVDSGDAILVCHKDRAQDVREVVDKLKSQGRVEFL